MIVETPRRHPLHNGFLVPDRQTGNSNSGFPVTRKAASFMETARLKLGSHVNVWKWIVIFECVPLTLCCCCGAGAAGWFFFGPNREEAQARMNRIREALEAAL